MHQKGLSAILLILIMAVIIAVGGYFIYQKQEKSVSKSDKIACTQDTKLCPDGSSVGRIGPNCEFAACPSSANGWITYTNSKYHYSFSYPKSESQLNEANQTSAKSNPYYQTRIKYCLSADSLGCITERDVFQVTVVTNENHISLDQWSKSPSFSPLSQDACYLKDPRSKVDRSKISNVDAATYEYIIDEDTVKSVCKNIYETTFYHAKGFLAAKDDFLYQVSINSPDPKNFLTLDKILSSFKFTQ